MRQTEGKTETDRDRKQSGAYRDRQIEREIDRQRERQTCRHTETGMQADRQKDTDTETGQNSRVIAKSNMVETMISFQSFKRV